MALAIQDEPLVVPQQLVLLLRLVNLLLVRQLLLLSLLIADLPFELLKEFLDLILSNLWLVNHQSSFLAQSTQARDDLFLFQVLASLVIEAKRAPVLSLFRLANRHIKMCRCLAGARDHIVDIDLDRLGVLAGRLRLWLAVRRIRTVRSFVHFCFFS